ncbi:TPA: hypothetical protein N0F65_011510 [Lagenidium giganteum]|uniref:Uncharacterized protein n=1 Tax=Lagenidium giganteum TaxID=4803 RepID=A0AAV2Z637_9STRA|nr:TPA: hypothetical protein N0F65_011510 [Lagenidium giganteum]
MLKRWNVKFQTRRRRNARADAKGSVCYRATYLNTKRGNLDARSNPRMPEVYLDESYFNGHHVPTKAIELVNFAMRLLRQVGVLLLSALVCFTSRRMVDCVRNEHGILYTSGWVIAPTVIVITMKR